MSLIHKISLLSLGFFFHLNLAGEQKTEKNKFYTPIITSLEGGKLNGILKSLNLPMPLFIVKLERHFQIIFNGSNFCFRKKR